MVGVARIELATPAMSTQCSTTELHAHTLGPHQNTILMRTLGFHLPCGGDIWKGAFKVRIRFPQGDCEIEAQPVKVR